LLDDVLDIDVNQQYEEEKYLKLELEDKLKASIFLVQFLALRPGLTQPDFLGASKSERGPSWYSENFYIPDRLYMTMNFYDFSTFKTEPLAFENYQTGKSKILSDRQPLVLVKEAFLKGGYDFKEPTYKFEVDPSVTRDKENLQRFVQYLYKKSLHIDLWDADTMMLYGTVKIPLRPLMRQGRQACSFSKEFDIIEPGFMRIKGGLQILLKNVGKTAMYSEVKENINKVTLINYHIEINT
jgi:nephrocystin-4